MRRPFLSDAYSRGEDAAEAYAGIHSGTAQDFREAGSRLVVILKRCQADNQSDEPRQPPHSSVRIQGAHDAAIEMT